MSQRRYARYKDSGVSWLGEVPADWSVLPLKRDLAFMTSGARGWAENYADEGELFLRIGNLTRNSIELDLSDIQRVRAPEGTEGTRTKVRPGDVLFSITAYLGSVAVVPDGLEPAYVSQHVALARPKQKRLLPRWIGYVALSYVGKTYLETQGYGGTKIQLGLDDVSNALMTVPSILEQRAIIDFLDRETAKIDVLIEEQERLIELLAEKRQAVISHAVTKGLDPDAEMKDSGVEWLGVVPAHWDVMPIRLAAKLESGHTPSRTHPEYWVAEACVVPWFTLADVWQIRDGETNYVFETKECVSEVGLANSAARLLPKGTVMLSRTASVGFSTIMGTEMATTQDFANWVCAPSLMPEYLLWTFRGMVREFERIKYGSTHNTIYMPDLQAMRFARPPLEEQVAIVRHIEKSITGFRALMGDARSVITLLQERRAALISAAVTGKIDVREHVAVPV